MNAQNRQDQGGSWLSHRQIWLVGAAAIGSGLFFYGSLPADWWRTGIFWLLLAGPAIEDGKTSYISDKWSAAIAAGGAAHWMTQGQFSDLWGAVIVIAVMGGLFLAVPGGMGAGDVLLSGAISLWLTVPGCVLFLILSFLTGGAAGAALLLSGRKGMKEGIPFGPFLCAGGGAAYAWGGQIVPWWLSLF